MFIAYLSRDNHVRNLCQRGIGMKPLQHRMAFVGAICLLIMTSVHVMAGGLVDTSADRFAAADFTNSASITNPWWTLTAGDNYLYYTEADSECAWNLVEVLHDTTTNFQGIYAGTEARIILDREWVDEDCIYVNFSDVWNNLDPDETTYDWYAQDTEQNIWYMGEDTLDGEGSSEGSFVAGCDGAEAGIVLLGSPGKGDAYQQEFYEDEAEDWGKVLNFKELGAITCMKTKEWTPLDPGHVEHKSYCSDGVTGELTRIHELKGKTVVVDLIARNVASPPPPAAPPSAQPNCAP